ncbi:MAG: ABC transporter ATP-binding protein [Patescibacteria group bacterium]
MEKIYRGNGAETRALDGVSFEIGKGEFVAIMGPSGSGKSTLLHILGFLDKQTKGEYFFDGRKNTDYSKIELARLRNKKMGFVFQSFNLLPRATVLENVKLPLLYSEVLEKDWNKFAKQAVESVGLSHRLNHKPSQLSGGEGQRVAIARALVVGPEIVFADEPTGNLDSKSGQAIMELLVKINKSLGRTVVLITHDQGIARYAKRTILLRDGKIESDKKQ